MKNVLVTGGAGYIGSHTCLELLENGYGVVVIDNLCNSNPESLNRVQKLTGKTLKFYEGDVRDEALLKKIFAENEISCVIHFAGLIGASNFFELAVAVAIALFGTASPAALATTVGVLTVLSTT